MYVIKIKIVLFGYHQGLMTLRVTQCYFVIYVVVNYFSVS